MEGCAEGDADVFGGVVVVDWWVLKLAVSVWCLRGRGGAGVRMGEGNVLE